MKARPDRVAWGAALVVFVVHAACNPHYGFFRDELYFIVCGFHPAWGYVDQPPVAPLLAAGTQLFGHSLFALRLVPAAFAAAGAFATCRLAVEFGGDAYSEVLTAIAYGFTGVLMSFGTKVNPDMAGLWLWPLIALFVFRIVRGRDARLWLAAGVAAGFAFETKYTIVFFAFAIVVGLLSTPQRRVAFSWWFVAGAAVAILIALPNVVWQAANHVPMLELLRNGHDRKNIHAGPLLYMFQQILITDLFFWPIWAIGLYATLRDGTTRFLGYAYLLLIACMLILGGKDYYPGDFYPILLAAGAVTISRWIRRPVWRWAVATTVGIAGLIFAPFSLPILSEAAMASYDARVENALGVHKSVLQTERGETATLPNDWADMHGWPELVRHVAAVYDRLPPVQRRMAAMYASNYGEASAINFFGPSLGLPPALSGHNNYWLWGPGVFDGAVLVEIGGSCFADLHAYRHATVAAYVDDRWAISYERHQPILVCTGPRQSLQQLWPLLKHYN